MEYAHRPVLVDEAVRTLLNAPDGLYVDGTAGCGGHSEAIARNLAPMGRLICLDRDPAAIELARRRLACFGQRVEVIRGNFANLDEILGALGRKEVNGVLLDLGISSHQIEHSGRGFSFARDEPLDMRMDLEDALTAGELVNRLSPRDLEDVLRRFGEERKARSIARAVERARKKGMIESAAQLAEIVQMVLPRRLGHRARHPATRTFQALRIAVNKELENLDSFLSKAPQLIQTGGRVVVLSYHSLEDRTVKQAMVQWEKGCQCPPGLPRCACGIRPLFRRLSKKGVKPSQKEIQENPRARSATLRAAERI